MAASTEPSEIPTITPIRLPTVAVFSLPIVGVNFSLVLTIGYITKYTVDVLFVAPATIALIFAFSRVWDAITDPLIGHWSDKTEGKLGRRRPWLLGSALPIAICGLLLWSPPAFVSQEYMGLWVGFMLFAYMTAMTGFLVPHFALGAELSELPHDRTRIFGGRHIFSVGGSALALVLGIYLLTNLPDPRNTAFWLMVGAGSLLAITVPIAVWNLSERSDYQGRVRASPFRSFGDVWRNPHGKRLIFLYLTEHIGSGASAVLSPFLMHYVIGMPEMTAFIFIPYLVSQFISVFIWTTLARRIGKRQTWLIGMLIAVVGYVTIFFVGHHDLYLMFFVVTLTGAASACGNVIGPSIQADVVDYDEYMTGERKEGAYFSVFTFLMKSSSGVMIFITGMALSLVGYEPNVEQTDLVKFTMSALMSWVSASCFIVGIWIFSRFQLSETEHARIRAELDARSAAQS
jgi:GPH family glycoside/pentoside/hexuronide:cation symporter